MQDNFPVQQKDKLFLKGHIFNLILKNRLAYC